MTDAVYSVLIAEDEYPAREKLIEYILARPELKVAGIAKDGEEAFKELASRKYDMVLLDIQLPHLSGIEVLERLKEIPYVIFITAYDQYAVKAFELGAHDYILKPFSMERFNGTVDRFLSRAANNEHWHGPISEIGLSFREKGKHFFIAYQDILYLSSHSKHTVIHTNGRDFETPSLLKELEEKLPRDSFFRIHKSYIVNLHHIASLEYKIAGHYQLILYDDDETILTVSRTFASSLKERLKIT
jgi:DNA-binding LytR/AlgR family response regulator